jgi:hypothetical protein
MIFDVYNGSEYWEFMQGQLAGDGRIPFEILMAGMTGIRLSFRGILGDARSGHFILLKQRPSPGSKAVFAHAISWHRRPKPNGRSVN